MAKGSGQARRTTQRRKRMAGPRSPGMGRRERRPELQISRAFEATRIAAQCLAGAYERLVPIPRRLPRVPVDRSSGAVAANAHPRPRSAEHG